MGWGWGWKGKREMGYGLFRTDGIDKGLLYYC